MLKATPVSLGVQKASPDRAIGNGEKGHRKDKGEDKETGHVKLIFPDLPRVPVHTVEVREGTSGGWVKVHLLSDDDVHRAEGGNEGAKKPTEQKDDIVVGADPDVCRGKRVQGGKVSVKKGRRKKRGQFELESAFLKAVTASSKQESKLYSYCNANSFPLFSLFS